jgi:hypothetical protein
MVHPSSEGPARPTTGASLGAHRTRKREARSLPRVPAETARPDGLDWDHFRDLYYPASRRHNLAAIVAYGAYRRTPRTRAPDEAAPVKDAPSVDAGSLGAWEDEGGSSRDLPGGGGDR